MPPLLPTTCPPWRTRPGVRPIRASAARRSNWMRPASNCSRPCSNPPTHPRCSACWRVPSSNRRNCGISPTRPA